MHPNNPTETPSLTTSCSNCHLPSCFALCPHGACKLCCIFRRCLACESDLHRYADACNVDALSMRRAIAYDPLARQQFNTWLTTAPSTQR